jgi:hypothetical protein
MILELNKQDAASWLEVSAPTLDRWIKSGKVNVRRIPDARIGQQSVVCLLEVPDVAPAPEPVAAPEPEPTAPTESADARYAREYLEGSATDSFGNSHLTADKVSALGPAPELPPKEIIQDAAAHWADWNSKFSPSDGTRDAAGPLAGRPNWYSKSEQQKRAAHDRAVIAASFPRGEKR